MCLHLQVQVVNDVEIIEGNDHTLIIWARGKEPSSIVLPLTNPPAQLNDSVSYTLLRGCLMLVHSLWRYVIDGDGVKHDCWTCEQVPVRFCGGGRRCNEESLRWWME